MAIFFDYLNFLARNRAPAGAHPPFKNISVLLNKALTCRFLKRPFRTATAGRPEASNNRKKSPRTRFSLTRCPWRGASRPANTSGGTRPRLRARAVRPRPRAPCYLRASALPLGNARRPPPPATCASLTSARANGALHRTAARRPQASAVRPRGLATRERPLPAAACKHPRPWHTRKRAPLPASACRSLPESARLTTRERPRAWRPQAPAVRAPASASGPRARERTLPASARRSASARVRPRLPPGSARARAPGARKRLLPASARRSQARPTSGQPHETCTNRHVPARPQPACSPRVWQGFDQHAPAICGGFVRRKCLWRNHNEQGRWAHLPIDP